MRQIPADNVPDSTLSLLFDGYEFISKKCQKYQSDVFETRLMLKKTICMLGQEACQVFYNNDLFQREGATPGRIQRTLFGQGGVQGMDGTAHRWRKQMFMSMMTPESIKQLSDLVADQWDASIRKWEIMDSVVLFEEIKEILCRAVCTWAGVPLAESEVKQRTDELSAMIDSPGAAGLRHWRGRIARQRAEEWAGDLIELVRFRNLEAPAESAINIIAWHRDLENELLDRQIAAVELLNVLRPTVAAARYVIFTAMALHRYPEYGQRIRKEKSYDEFFVQEVRRYYPFFPFVAARVKKEFEWKGYFFPTGRRVILDLYGTNRDARLWESPDEFRPDRFEMREENAFDLIPQGGGDFYENHRCPGEWITMEIMKVALRFFTENMEYYVPEQDLSMDLTRVPAIPESRFVIEGVHRKNPA
ncbi:cytochrome P450 [Methanosarcina hadiensis]|uniref:cytochrome P450 n=1 Tax=Methanosarcina hadiensis TaxID=3078083 RepID=UPI003977BA21